MKMLWNLIALIFLMTPDSQLGRVAWLGMWLYFAGWILSHPISWILRLFS